MWYCTVRPSLSSRFQVKSKVPLHVSDNQLFQYPFPSKYTTSISRYTRFWNLQWVSFYLGSFKRILWEQVIGLGRKIYSGQVANPNKVLWLRNAAQQWCLLPEGMTWRTKTWSRRHVYQHSPLMSIKSRVLQKWRSHSETEISQAAHPLNYLKIDALFPKILNLLFPVVVALTQRATYLAVSVIPI